MPSKDSLAAIFLKTWATEINKNTESSIFPAYVVVQLQSCETFIDTISNFA